MKKRTSATLLLAALTLASANAQTYRIEGTAPEGAVYVYLQNRQAGGQAPDSVRVEGGKFEFAGEANGAVFGLLFSDNSEALRKEPLPVVLDGNVWANLKTCEVGGTEENDSLSVWNKRHADLNARAWAYNALFAGYDSEDDMPADKKSHAQEVYRQLVADQNAWCVELGDSHRDYIFPAYFLFPTVLYHIDHAKVMEWIDAKAAFMQVSLMQRAHQAAAAWKNTETGAPLVDVEVVDTAGTPRKLSDYIGRGQYVLLDFWSSACGPCLAEAPNMRALREKYGAKGFEIVGLSLDSKKAAWRAAIDRKQMNWVHVSELKGWRSKAVAAYGVSATPQLILFGPDGRVIDGEMDIPKLTGKLQEIFGF